MSHRSPLLVAALLAAGLPACGGDDDRAADVPADLVADDAAADSGPDPGADADSDVLPPDTPADVAADTAADTGDVAAVCGPFPGGACADTELCDLRSCADGASGVCVPRPAECVAVEDPVCGCDGVTYSNDCERLRSGAALAYTGACGSGTLCGGTAGFRCPAGETCDVRDCRPHASGTCVPVSDSCETLYAPVCGCDGVTYSNDCARLVAGVALDHEGICDAVPACVPECRAVGATGTGWVDPCTGRTLCVTACTGCTAECQAVDSRSEGWYAVCSGGTVGGCGVAGSASLIEWTDCAP